MSTLFTHVAIEEPGRAGSFRSPIGALDPLGEASTPTTDLLESDAGIRGNKLHNTMHRTKWIGIIGCKPSLDSS